MIATGVMSAIHSCVAKAMFSTTDWQQAGASNGNGGNAIVLAGLSQWVLPLRRTCSRTRSTPRVKARVP